MPISGDFSGAGYVDYTVYRPSNQTWYRLHTDENDGDGKLDIAVFRPSEGKWYVLTTTSSQLSQTFALNGDIPTESAFIYSKELIFVYLKKTKKHAKCRKRSTSGCLRESF